MLSATVVFVIDVFDVSNQHGVVVEEAPVLSKRIRSITEVGMCYNYVIVSVLCCRKGTWLVHDP